MKRALPWLLVLTAVLTWSYGRQRARDAVADERERVLRVQITGAARRADSLTATYAASRSRADSLERHARVVVVYRGRAVASTDSAVARVDTVLQSLDSASAAIVRRLTVSFQIERQLSSDAIASLTSALDAKDAALSASDSLIASLHARIAVSDSLLTVLTKRAHPSMVSRALSFARHAAVGAAVAMVWMAGR